jgi:hypothetical protein
MDNKLLLVFALLVLAFIVNKKCSTSVEGYENTVQSYDPTSSNNSAVTEEYPKNESLIYDNVTGSVMSGTQWQEKNGIVSTRWIAPAWDPDAHGPSSLGELNPSDYENDPRMLYNKCSLSCCSEQYPTPFQTVKDPFVFDENGKLKFLTSDYNCTNNVGGTGCLCMTEKQSDGLQSGFVNYKVNEKLGF